jgi:hypothetical protein
MSAPSPRRGLKLSRLQSCQCRFPLSGEGEGTLFCGAAVQPAEWSPGRSGGSYCRHHRVVARGIGTIGERTAVRVARRLAGV